MEVAITLPKQKTEFILDFVLLTNQKLNILTDEMTRIQFSPDHPYSVPLGELVQVELAVLSPRPLSVGQNPAATHHGSSRPQVGHCGRNIQPRGVMGCQSHLDASAPLVHKAIQTYLEQLIVLHWSVSHNHPIVKLIEWPLPLSCPIVVQQLDKAPVPLVEPDLVVVVGTTPRPAHQSRGGGHSDPGLGCSGHSGVSSSSGGLQINIIQTQFSSVLSNFFQILQF